MASYDKYIYSSSTHYISNSGHDENGRYSGGKAGDQTGGEWQLRSWYNRPWNCVLRYEKDEKVGMKLAELSCAAALNDNIGYDQNERYTYWNHLQINRYDPSRIKTPCEADCSAGVIANVRACGHLLGIDALKNVAATYTGNMRSDFKARGFSVLTDTKYLTDTAYLLPGDILLNDVHHVCVNVTRGSKAGSSPTTTKQTATGGTVTATGIATGHDKALAGKYKAMANLSLRNAAGTSNKELVEIPKGTIVNCYGYCSIDKGIRWLYISVTLAGTTYIGFSHSGYLTKV